MGLWRGTKELFGWDVLGKVRRDLLKLEVKIQHPDAWPIVWYGPKVAAALFITGLCLCLWAFLHVLSHYPDEFWKPVAGAAGAGTGATLTLLVRRALQGAKK